MVDSHEYTNAHRVYLAIDHYRPVRVFISSRGLINMASRALDFTTMGHALAAVSERIKSDDWQSSSPESEHFLQWYRKHRDELLTLKGLEALVSPDLIELNLFLEEHGFMPMFDDFEGMGVVSILDMLVNWLVEGTDTVIRRKPWPNKPQDATMYPAFQLHSGVSMYRYHSHQYNPLIRIETQTGHSLWLVKSPFDVSEGVVLANQAQLILEANRTLWQTWDSSMNWSGLVMPKLDLAYNPDLSWMLGVNTPPDWSVSQAFQQFRLRVNEKGARAKVATGFAVTRGFTPEPKPYVLDEPFVGFFTAPGHDNLPLAVFYADVDSWREPAGTLEEL